jgi:hypothetical protein
MLCYVPIWTESSILFQTVMNMKQTYFYLHGLVSWKNLLNNSIVHYYCPSWIIGFLEVSINSRYTVPIALPLLVSFIALFVNMYYNRLFPLLSNSSLFHRVHKVVYHRTWLFHILLESLSVHDKFLLSQLFSSSFNFRRCGWTKVDVHYMCITVFVASLTLYTRTFNGSQKEFFHLFKIWQESAGTSFLFFSKLDLSW